jgi:very-short-patch-repair endonuclease
VGLPADVLGCPHVAIRLNIERLTALADRHGLITRADVMHSGFARAAWGRAANRGDLVVVADGVGVLPGTDITPIVNIAAAVRCAHGIASHRSAAYLHGVWRSGDRPVEVIRPTGRDVTARMSHVITHRPRDRQTVPFVNVHGISCTTPARTLVDFAGLRPRNVFDVLVAMRAAQLLTLSDLDHELSTRPSNVPGAAAARRALERQAITTSAPDSVLEARFAELCRAHGLPPVEHHAIVLGYEIDFRFVGTDVLVECDGFAFHGRTAEQFDRDRRRDAELSAAGYLVIRVTWGMVTESPAAVARTILLALQHHSR